MRANRREAETIGLGDERYPENLRNVFDPPPVLYVRGALAAADALAVAVVGSRKASAYGLTVAESLARELVGFGITVVSGLALGIDAAAHHGALAAGGRTIAVLGCGIDRIYPDRHRRLGEAVAGSGALVSELPPGTPPLAYQFPRRNRIISGLAHAVVVVEADEYSGSLITARLALEQGRDVLAVPGEVGLPRTRGVHRLIRQGAALVENGHDVVEEVFPWLLATARKRGHSPFSQATAEDEDGLRPTKKGSDPFFVPRGEATRLLAAFVNRVEHVDQLIERSALAPGRVLELLLELELAGLVDRHPGMLYARKGV